jgi:hypothetical protein
VRDTRTTKGLITATHGVTEQQATGLLRGRFQTDGRTDDQTMAAGASVT